MSEVKRAGAIRVLDEKGKYKDLSVDQIIASQRNLWQGWHCHAGSQFLYIDYDGNVFFCNNASSKVDRFNHQGWQAQIKHLKENEGIDLGSEENLSNGTHDKYLKKFEKSGDGFKNLIDLNDKEEIRKYPGFLGNIYQGFNVLDTSIVCPFKQCGCGADVATPKSKEKYSFEELRKVMNCNDRTPDNPNNLTFTDEVLGKESGVIPLNLMQIPRILWDLGRRCNFDCTYCWPAVHNAKEEHKPIDTVITTIDKIINEFSPGVSKLFCFSGGEPTLHPDCQKIFEYLSSNNQRSLITTNGSLHPEKWAKLAPHLDTIQLSVHFEFLNEKRIIENVATALDCGKYVDLKFMTPPGYVKRSLDLKDKVFKLDQWKKSTRKVFSIVPLRKVDNSEELMDYSEEELEIFKNQS